MLFIIVITHYTISEYINAVMISLIYVSDLNIFLLLLSGRIRGLEVHIMDVTFNNVLEGTRPYFMGVPKASPLQTPGSGQLSWSAITQPLEEEIPAVSGAPTPNSRPPSTAAAPPSTPRPPTAPPRPPSEPIEPEPHIIHKATVMREALEKRREREEPEDEETDDATCALSPPSHIIRKPPHALPSPCPSPVRPPSVATLKPPPAPTPPQPRAPTPRQPTESQPESPRTAVDPATYRHVYRTTPSSTNRPPDHYANGRPSDSYTGSRPAEAIYSRYPYDNNPESTRGLLACSSTQQSVSQARHSPQQTYARISSSLPQNSATRLRDISAHSPPTQRYVSASPSLPHNDRVPPIHHPVPTSQRVVQPDSRSSQIYSSHHRTAIEASPYTRLPAQYDRHPSMASRKFDSQQGYPGYRSSSVIPQPIQNNHRIEALHHSSHLQYKPVVLDTPVHPPVHYPTRPPDQTRPHDSARLPSRPDYTNINRTVEDIGTRTIVKSNYQYPTPSTSNTRYSNTSAPVAQNVQRPTYRPAPAPKPNYDYPGTNHISQSQTSSARLKASYANQQARMTVSVTSLVNQMNQTKQKRESPLDLSVKTVKNSADSSTTPDDIDSCVTDSKNISLQHRPISNSRQPSNIISGYVSSHKVDFSPDFQSQYRERTHNHVHTSVVTPAHPPTIFNGSYDIRQPPVDSYPIESRHQSSIYIDQNKNSTAGARQELPVQRIDLTRSTGERHMGTRIRDERHYMPEESRKRVSGTIVNNIPEKIVRYETWSADSRIDDRMNRSAREQHELMSRPVYSYSSHKRLEAFQTEQKRPTTTTSYRENMPNNRYSYSTEHSHREPTESNNHYLDRNPTSNGRHVIQKASKEVTHHVDHSGIPADKRVLSILRNSLETKHTGFVEPARPARQIPDLIVIDDVDDSVIEITDLTKDNDPDKRMKNAINSTKDISTNTINKVQMPKAIDSFSNDKGYEKLDNTEGKRKSPEYDVASRIRTKAELKVMPPQQENSGMDLKHEHELESNPLFHDKQKLIPKSQKQHLFNQIREDSLRLESVTKNDNQIIAEIKTEPMNIDEIEKDAEIPIKTEDLIKQSEDSTVTLNKDDDLDWASACDSFVEQLKVRCNKKPIRRKRLDTETENKLEALSNTELNEQLETVTKPSTSVVVKQEPTAEVYIENAESSGNNPMNDVIDKEETSKLNISVDTNNIKKEIIDEVRIKTEIQDTELNSSISKDLESTDDDEPLIKSKLMKDKEKREQFKYRLLKDLSEKSAYVKLECCDVDVTKPNKADPISKEKETESKGRIFKNSMKVKKLGIDNNKNDKITEASSSDSDSDAVVSRLRTRRKPTDKIDDTKTNSCNKSSLKSPTKKQDNSSNSSMPYRKYGFGDGSDFHPGWEEELYRYKRSLRMPTRLIAIPRGRSGGPFGRTACALLARGSTSLPDLDPVPLSPAPSSTPSAATDDFFARRQDKHILDSDLDSNSSCSAVNRLHYDSEASTSTIFSSNKTKKRESIIDVLIQKYGKKEESKKNKNKSDIKTKSCSKGSSDILSTSCSSMSKLDTKGCLNSKQDSVMENIFYLRDFKKENVNVLNKTLNDTDKVKGNREKSILVKLKSRTRTESRTLKQRATLKEVFGDERPASAPPSACRQDDSNESDELKKNTNSPKIKTKCKKIMKDKLKRRSSSIRDGLRSTKSLKRNDAKGRLLRLKKRNNFIKSLENKKTKHFPNNKKKSPAPEHKDAIKDEGESPVPTEVTRKRFKRLFARRKFSSGFDYIRKKKKIIRKEESANKIRRVTVKPTPESETDIHKEIKSWFINKSIGETLLHRAARLGYTVR